MKKKVKYTKGEIGRFKVIKDFLPVPLDEDEKQELEKRLESFYQNPGNGSPWKKVKQKILAKK